MIKHNLDNTFSDISENRINKELQCSECGSELRLLGKR